MNGHVAKVKDYPDLVKKDGGVINVNQDEYIRAKTRQKQQMRFAQLENKVNSMEENLHSILSLLNDMVNKNNR